MHGLQLLHNLLLKSCPEIHSCRLNSLMEAIEGLFTSGKLTLVNIGRGILGKVKIKHRIKQIDRLLCNEHLYSERILIYRSLACAFIVQDRRPIILIDWSGVTQCGTYHMIRASVSYKGRSLTLLEEVYPEKKKDSPKANRGFLKRLSDILPAGCQPIIVTDAGFRNPWFREVLKLGWDYVGRVRNRTQVCQVGQRIWLPCKSFYAKAKSKAVYLGEYLLARSNPLGCKLHLFKERPKHRKKTNLKGKKVRCSSSLKHAKGQKEPWLLATSLWDCAQEIVRIYKLRMRIEQGFRDIKNRRNGFCMEQTRSSGIKRLSILLLIGALATFIACIYGRAGQYLKMHYQYQTNSVKNRSVLSWFVIGLLMIRDKGPPKNIIKEFFNEKLRLEIDYAA